jgi:UDP-glucuronate decarboxylase
VNLGNPRETSILDIARTVIRLTGSSSPIVHRDLPEDDPKQRCPDISLARKALEWEPTTGLTEGLVRTIEHFRKAAT